VLAAVFFLVSAAFVYRSFYGMRIEGAASEAEAPRTAQAGRPERA